MASSYEIHLGFCSSNTAQPCLCTNCPVLLLSHYRAKGVSGSWGEWQKEYCENCTICTVCLFTQDPCENSVCWWLLEEENKSWFPFLQASKEAGACFVTCSLQNNPLQLQKALATETVQLRVLWQWGHHYSLPNNCFLWWLNRHKMYCKGQNPAHKGLSLSICFLL